MDELAEHGMLDAVDFAARHRLHYPSTRGMLIALSSSGIIRRRDDLVTTGPHFEEANRTRSLFHWLTRGSSALFAAMPTVMREDNRVGDYYHRDPVAISLACREANTVCFDPAFWAAMDNLDLEVATVADLGCGSGGRLRQIADRYPTSRGVGVDIAAAALEVARKDTENAGLGGRITFIEADATNLGVRPEFDDVELVTSFMMGHDMWPREDCVKTLRGIREVFPRVRRMLLGDSTRTVGIPDEDIPIFTLGFELGHELMGAYIPTTQEWRDVFAEAGWTCRQEYPVPVLTDAVVFDLEPAS
ncbi:SAM-dependent methyltransferase [Actinoalloteichus sp. AHMU CJ021]|nr:SAM-dependent methyltransferase [Actinoalloteichus sp. AHMU CJ021]